MALAIVDSLSRIIASEEIDLPSDQLFRKIGIVIPVLLATVLFSYDYSSPVSCILYPSSSGTTASAKYINYLCRSSEWFSVDTNFTNTVPKPLGELPQGITWHLFYQAFGHAVIFWVFYQLPVKSTLQPFLTDARKIQEIADEEVGDELVEEVGDEETGVQIRPVISPKKRIVNILNERLHVLTHSNVLYYYCIKTLFSILLQLGFLCHYTHVAFQHVHKQVLCRPTSGPLYNRIVHCSVLTASLSSKFVYFGMIVAVLGIFSGLRSLALMLQSARNLPYNTYRKIPEILERYNAKAKANGDKPIDEMEFKTFVFNTTLTKIVSRQIIFAINLVRDNIDQCKFDYIYQNVFEYFSIEQFLLNNDIVKKDKPEDYSGKQGTLHFSMDSVDEPELASADALSKDFQDKVLVPIHKSKSTLYSAEVCIAKALFGNPPIAEAANRFFMRIHVKCVSGHLKILLDDVYFKTIIRNDIIDLAKKSKLPLHKKEIVQAQINADSHQLVFNDIELAACLFNRRIVIIKKTEGQLFQVVRDFNPEKEEKEEKVESAASQAREIIYLRFHDKRKSYSLYREQQRQQQQEVHIAIGESNGAVEGGLHASLISNIKI